MFFLTILSVYVVPVFFRSLDIGQTLQDLSDGAGIEFTVALMSILLIHEMGHFVAGRRRNIITSWPYFIPAPNFIGTFGAIIKSRSPFWNRRDLIEVGAAGPIAGWIVAVAWLIYGLSHSTYVPLNLESHAGLVLGDSLSMTFLTNLVMGPAPEGYTACSATPPSRGG